MTDPTYTGLLLVVDRSGSMTTIRDDMVGGLTHLLRTQAAEPGRLTVDVVLFDDRYETTTVLADPATVEIELEPRGMTALHDALGRAVTEYGGRLAALDEDARPGTVIVVVATDGLENASREYSGPAVRRLVEQQRDAYGWDFVFLGANQDAVTTGGELGFARESAIDFDADREGADAVTVATTAYLSTRRAGKPAAFTDEDRSRSQRRRR